MSNDIQVGVCQYNPVIGDIEGNSAKLAEMYHEAADGGADLVVTPELSLVGYPPRDLLHRTSLLNAQQKALAYLAEQTHDGPPLIVGAALRMNGKTGPPIRNTAVVLRDGKQPDMYHKRLLPSYDIFDERRYFNPGEETLIEVIDDVTVGITIGEDAWNDQMISGQRRYACDPLAETSKAGADVIVTIGANPYSINAQQKREDQLIEHAAGTGCPVVFVNQVGGNDELVFDGHSFVATSGSITDRLAGFKSETKVVDVPVTETVNPHVEPYRGGGETEIRKALHLGVKDYFEKTGFTEAVVGLSGGVDSAVTAALAVDAVGRDNVHGITMPSHVTSQESLTDAEEIAENLGIQYHNIPISSVTKEFSGLFTEDDTPIEGVPMENLQARIRGIVLMTVANRKNALVLSPTTKSESAVGYYTMYGDSVGGIAPLGDCYKDVVYDLAKEYNRSPPGDAPVESGRNGDRAIPAGVIEKAPTAGLRPGQRDTDELPAYSELDPVLASYIDSSGTAGRSGSDEALDSELAHEIIQQVADSEFKRQQSPPPIRITKKALGRGWRYPIAAEYRHVTDKNYTTDYHQW